MKIEIEKDKNPNNTAIRKAKLLSIKSGKTVEIDYVGYTWKITPEVLEESIEDFHMFCVSIVKDLVTSRFYTNEQGNISYEDFNLDADENKKLYSDLGILFDKIKNKKKKNGKSNLWKQTK